MENPTVTFPSIDFSGALGYLTNAISSVVVPNIGYIAAAAALTGAVGWGIRKLTKVVKVRG